MAAGQSWVLLWHSKPWAVIPDTLTPYRPCMKMLDCFCALVLQSLILLQWMFCAVSNILGREHQSPGTIYNCFFILFINLLFPIISLLSTFNSSVHFQWGFLWRIKTFVFQYFVLWSFYDVPSYAWTIKLNGYFSLLTVLKYIHCVTSFIKQYKDLNKFLFIKELNTGPFIYCLWEIF